MAAAYAQVDGWKAWDEPSAPVADAVHAAWRRSQPASAGTAMSESHFSPPAVARRSSCPCGGGRDLPGSPYAANAPAERSLSRVRPAPVYPV